METISSEMKPVTVPEALKVIPVSREAFYRKLKKGELPCWRFGKRILVDVNQILEAMRSK
ncbi:MAG: helix-turn-helix domain-containing protein [Nitrospirales bacterium]|nr:helix-turn-helix domain-containing protein [Nitrospirales bacterium]